MYQGFFFSTTSAAGPAKWGLQKEVKQQHGGSPHFSRVLLEGDESTSAMLTRFCLGLADICKQESSLLSFISERKVWFSGFSRCLRPVGKLHSTLVRAAASAGGSIRPDAKGSVSLDAKEVVAFLQSWWFCFT